MRHRVNGRASPILIAWVCLMVVGFALPEASAGPEDAGDENAAEGAAISWLRDLEQAFKQSAEENKILLICINEKNPIGERQEPAAKGLREIIYKEPTVVERSKAFICVFLNSAGSSADYGELRVRLGIDGLIVSPQHIFVHPKHQDGDKPLFREQYWRYGSGPESHKQLLLMMDKAQAAYRVAEGMPAGPGDGATQSPEQRAAWIQTLTGLARQQDPALRKKALAELVAHDKDGDCLAPLVEVLKELSKAGQPGHLADVVRALGIPGQEAAAPALMELLKHKDPAVRGNAAVSLEYIGSSESAAELLSRAKREKDAKIKNHLYRAAGRCAAGDATTRKKLLRASLPAKDGDFGSFGAVIGLAYFKGDAKAARSLEKQLLKLGSPLQQGSKAHGFLRAEIVWCLSEIGDPKSASFLRKKMIAPLAEEKSPWKGTIEAYYEAVARVCEGDEKAQAAVRAGIFRARWMDKAHELVDEYRQGRDMSRFIPKGEWGNEPKED